MFFKRQLFVKFDTQQFCKLDICATCCFQILWKNTKWQFSFKLFLSFLCKGVKSAIFKQDGKEDDLKELLMFVRKKSAKMFKFSLIVLMGISESLEALFLSNLSMSFFMSSILTSEKRNVSFSQFLCIAGMVGWSLCLNIALRVGSPIFSVKNQTRCISKYSNSLLYLKRNYLEIQ